MNRITGIISDLKVDGNLTLVRAKVEDQLLTSVIINTPTSRPRLKKGQPVGFLFKETEVIIAKGNIDGVSMQNKILGKITSIQSALILSKISIETTFGPIDAIITTNAVNQLNLNEQDEVVAMIKTNEMMLSL